MVAVTRFLHVIFTSISRQSDVFKGSHKVAKHRLKTEVVPFFWTSVIYQLCVVFCG